MHINEKYWAQANEEFITPLTRELAEVAATRFDDAVKKHKEGCPYNLDAGVLIAVATLLSSSLLIMTANRPYTADDVAHFAAGLLDHVDKTVQQAIGIIAAKGSEGTIH